MEQNIYLTNLYDYYGELLTDKQKEYFEYYYMENLSLSEISENYNVSRNAVHKQIKDAENKLLFYESKLMLSEKSKKIEELLKDVDEKIKEEILDLV